MNKRMTRHMLLLTNAELEEGGFPGLAKHRTIATYSKHLMTQTIISKR